MGDDRTGGCRLDPLGAAPHTVVSDPHPILIGIGGNLASPRWGTPRETLTAALAALTAEGVAIAARSSWYRSEPVPASDQPWFVNAVAAVETGLDARDLLALMQQIETRFGRVRSAPNAARTVDLDLLDYRGALSPSPELSLPHPRLHQRRFVLVPLCEIAPRWRHPRYGATARELLDRLVGAERVERMPA
jgi:2-amino-4-hydroxy-6-hydroxymethyldihydropteridine diphosphokinase